MTTTSGGHSIGSLETWEDEDKTFTKHTIQAGSGDGMPNEGSVCVVFLNPLDFEIDEDQLGTYKLNEEVEVTIGEGDTRLSALWDKVVMSMKEGEQSYIKSKVNTKGKKVGEFDIGKEALRFNMTLKSFNRAADPQDLEGDEKLERAQHHKNKGTELYQQNRMEFSMKRFSRAQEYLDMLNTEDLPESLRADARRLRCVCFLNLGACYLKAEKFERVIENCSKALELEPDNVKGLFRRGQASLRLHQYDKAKADLQKAQRLEPKNKSVLNELKNLEGLIKKEKEMYQKMFSS